MEPDVLYLILCDAVRLDPSNYHRYNVIGVATSIRAVGPLPLVQPQLTVLALWIGGQGPGELTLRIVEDQSGNIVFRTRRRRIRFVGDSAAIGGAVFHIRNCSFPSKGLYWIEVLFVDSVIARQRFFIRE